MEKEVYIFDISRVPTGKKGGIYRQTPPERLASFLLNKINERNKNLESYSGEVVLANAIGTMGNMARNAVLGSEFNPNTVATTLDFQCGGSYKSISIASALILSNQRDWVIAGGMESNSLKPNRSYHSNDPRKKKDKTNIEVAAFSPFDTLSLEKGAEELGKKFNISKLESQQWMLDSHKKAKESFESGIFNNYVLAINTDESKDEPIKSNLSTTLFSRYSDNIYIDATNTADFHDGAGVVLLGSKKLIDLGLKPLAKILLTTEVGINPSHSPEGALIVAEELIKSSKVDIEQIDLFEVCESYAVKPLAFAKHFGINPSKINILGSNLAMGHPFAASGIINLLNLHLALKSQSKKTGLLCAGIAGGLGAAVLIENLS